MRTQTRRGQILWPLISIAAITLFPGCSQDPLGADWDGEVKGPRPDPIQWELVVLPTASELEAGETVQLRAFLRDDERGIQRQVVADWSSDDPKAAQVSAAGLVEAYGEGQVRITASLREAGNDGADSSTEARALIVVH